MKTVRTLAAIACLAAAGPVLSGSIAGQKLDNGLGDLPHYSKWTDPTGRDPMGASPVRVAASTR